MAGHDPRVQVIVPPDSVAVRDAVVNPDVRDSVTH